MGAWGLKLFISYAHEDEFFRRDLEKHLAGIKREGLVEEWYDRMIRAGQDWDREINVNLDSSHIILLLISPDFMASNYCNEVETKRAMQRQEMGTARVIPVLLRPTDWQGSPFAKLQAVPTDARPISEWKDRDGGFLDVIQHLREVCRELAASPGNPANPYVAAKVGDWYQAEVVIELHTTNETKLGSIFLTLVEKNDQRAVIRAKYSSPDLGVHEEKTIEVFLDRPLEDSLGQIVGAITSEQMPANMTLECHQTGAGAEKLFIGGKPYYTTWVETEAEVRMGRDRMVQKGRKWMSSEIPLDGIVKLVFEVPGVVTQTLIVTDYGREGERLRAGRPPMKPEPPKPPQEPLTLDRVIVGNWNVQIQQLPGPAVAAEFSFNADGLFSAKMMLPMYGMVTIQGQWRVQGWNLALQGVQTAWLINVPYVVQITFNNASSRMLKGVSTIGEQITFTR